MTIKKEYKDVYYWQRKRELITLAEVDFGDDESDWHHLGVDPHTLKFYAMSGGGCSCWDGGASEQEYDTFENMKKHYADWAKGVLEYENTHNQNSNFTIEDISFLLLEAQANYEIFKTVFQPDTDVEKFIILPRVFNKELKQFHRLAIDTASLESISLALEVFLAGEWQEITRFNLSPKGVDKVINEFTQWKTREPLIYLIN